MWPEALSLARVGCAIPVSIILLGLLSPGTKLAHAQRPSADTTTAGSYPSSFNGIAAAVSVASNIVTASDDADRSWLTGADSGANDGSSSFFRINPVSGTLRLKGETGFVDVTDVAFLPDGRLFGVTFTHLLQIDPQSGQATVIGTGIGFDGVNALVADRNGTLYAATISTLFQPGGRFLRIDTASGTGTPLGFYGGGLNSSGDLAFDENGTLFATATTGSFADLLVRVDVRTGQAVVIGSIGFPEIFGLAFGPDGILYGSAMGDRFSTPQLIRIDTVTGAGTPITNLIGANGMFGLAARVTSSPVEGPLRVTGPENPQCANASGLSTFCQHRTGLHAPGGGVQDSDDTFAWDVNLAGNADKGLPVLPLAPGRVVRYAGVVLPQNTSGAVLVEHSLDGSSCSVAPSKCWWSGYLHMSDVVVHEGDLVDMSTVLGRVGSVSPFPTPDHLHLVVYEGANVQGGLRSVDAVFLPRFSFRGGVFVASGNLNGAGPDEILTGAGQTGGPHVRSFSANGAAGSASFFAYNAAFGGGVRVASCDVNGDGVDDIVTAPGPGGGPHIRIFDGVSLSPIGEFFAYSPLFTGGVFVACGDFDRDGRAEVVTGADAGGGPHVVVWRLIPGPLTVVWSFFAYDPAFRGGVRVAACDANGDGVADVVTAAGPSGGPHVRVFDGTNPANELAGFFAYAPTFTGGAFVACGDVVGTSAPEIVTGADAGGGPHVRLFTGQGADTGLGFFAYDPGFPGGVRVAVGEVDGAPPGEIITGPGFGSGPYVRAFTAMGMATTASFFAY